MRDLTVGSIESHLVRLAVPIAAGMLFQTLYYLVDLYFVARLGDVAIAGVAAAGNAVFLIMALTNMIGAGTLALLAQAVGRKDRVQANLVFNQSSALAALFAVATLIVGYPLCALYMRGVAADHATAVAGTTYIFCYLPGLALQFIITAMGSALRGTGLVRPTLIVQSASLTLNIVLAPILIAGWFTHHPFGVAGAGLASSIALIAGTGMLLFYFLRLETYVTLIASDWRPRLNIWWRLLSIGLPSGGEFAILFFYTAVIFALIRHFGDAAQAGFGLGTRLMQAIFLPGMAIAFAAAPIAGQNFGAGHASRVRATLRAAIAFCTVVMMLLTLLCQWHPEWLVQGFTKDPEVVEQATIYLRIISWNFVATGIIYSSAALFQALGNTWPSLLSTGSRVFTFIGPALWIASRPHFRIEQIWYLSVATVALQAVTSLALLLREFRRRMPSQPLPLESAAAARTADV